MEHNPHSLNQILIRIREQMRCPQCGTPVAVDFPSVKLASEEFVLLQLKCESCSAFIVLHVNMANARQSLLLDHDGQRNASSSLCLDENEMRTLTSALKDADGSFEKLFNKMVDDTSGGGTSAFV